MAMNKAVLGAAIKSKMLGINPDDYDFRTPEGIEEYRTAVLEAFADAIISHIQSAAVVTTTVPGTGLVAPSGAVTGAATGTGSIS